jgi:hypothetical protein
MTPNQGMRTSTSGRSVRAVLVALVAVLVVACGDRELTGREELRPGQFVEIVVELRDADWETSQVEDPDSAAVEFERRKAEILERHGATEESLRRFVELYHRRPGMMSAVWDSISHRIQGPASGESGDPYLPTAEDW